MKYLLEFLFGFRRAIVSPFAKYRKKPLYPVGSKIHFYDCSMPVVRTKKDPGEPWVYFLADKPDEAESEAYLRSVMDSDRIYDMLVGNAY